MSNKNEITGDIIKSKHSNIYADNFDKIFIKDTELTEEELEELRKLLKLPRKDAQWKYQLT